MEGEEEEEITRREIASIRSRLMAIIPKRTLTRQIAIKASNGRHRTAKAKAEDITSLLMVNKVVEDPIGIVISALKATADLAEANGSGEETGKVVDLVAAVVNKPTVLGT